MEFDEFDSNRKLLISISAILSAKETEHRPFSREGFWQPTVDIETPHGKMIVYDYNRAVMRRIQEAQSSRINEQNFQTSVLLQCKEENESLRQQLENAGRINLAQRAELADVHRRAEQAEAALAAVYAKLDACPVDTILDLAINSADPDEFKKIMDWVESVKPQLVADEMLPEVQP